MNILLTGCNGYIGSVLTAFLRERGHVITGLDSNYYTRCLYEGSLPSIPLIEKDIRSVNERDLAPVEAVVHLAGLSNDPLGDFRPELTEQINTRASLRLARLAKKRGVRRFVFASSCSVYGAAGDAFLTEQAPFNPVTPYGRSKVEVEQGLRELADDSFSPTCLRASTAYGCSPLIRFDLVLNNLTAWAYTTQKIFLKSDGSAWRPLVHVEDICRAYTAVLEAPREEVHNEAFNVGTTSENYRIRDLAEIIAEVIPDCQLAFAPDASPDKRCYRVDCGKIASRLHAFKPQWTARRGAMQLYESFLRNGLSLEAFEGEQFKRIAHIKYLIRRGLLDESLRRIDHAPRDGRVDRAHGVPEEAGGEPNRSER
jgi:nucleoside-diphosphate-sugar epimerase